MCSPRPRRTKRVRRAARSTDFLTETAVALEKATAACAAATLPSIFETASPSSLRVSSHTPLKALPWHLTQEPSEALKFTPRNSASASFAPFL